MSLEQKSLRGHGVLVTRPVHQAQAFIQLLQSAGAHTISFPSIEILPVTESDALYKAADPANDYRIIIFISANAVDNGVKWLQNTEISLKNAKIAAIGNSTKIALEKKGLTVDISPQQAFNSEALLQLDDFDASQIRNQCILIIKGEGGRELLQDTLTAKGARVVLAEVYKRKIPDADIQPLLENWSQNQIQWVTVTSNETLKNLYYMLNEQGQEWLRNSRLIVPSERCQQLAQQLGVKQILLAQAATDQAMLDVITQNALKH